MSSNSSEFSRSIRILATDGMNADVVQQLRDDGFAITEQFYEPDELGMTLQDSTL